jgi:hypothetical protein
MSLLDFSLAFVLETDASGTGLGDVLMQKGRPISYFIKALGPRSAALSTYYKEALAILETLKHRERYFLGRELRIKRV